MRRLADYEGRELRRAGKLCFLVFWTAAVGCRDDPGTRESGLGARGTAHGWEGKVMLLLVSPGSRPGLERRTIPSGDSNGRRRQLGCGDVEVVFAESVGAAKLLLEFVDGDDHVRPVGIGLADPVGARPRPKGRRQNS